MRRSCTLLTMNQVMICGETILVFTNIATRDSEEISNMASLVEISELCYSHLSIVWRDWFEGLGRP